MEAVSFVPEHHFDDIRKWAMIRGMIDPPLEYFSKTGRVVNGVCAIFLYSTDSCVGFIENLITNPEADPKTVTEAVSRVVTGIEADAKAKGMKLLRSSTYIPGVMKRAKNLGFQVSKENYKLLEKEI